jgi:hypothetical protein
VASRTETGTFGVGTFGVGTFGAGEESKRHQETFDTSTKPDYRFYRLFNNMIVHLDR